MVKETLNLWGKGAVTLPKEWRDRYPTTHFMAVEVPEGLLIKPIVDIEYYESEDGTVGLRFPMGIEAGSLADRLEEELSTMRSPVRKKKGKSRIAAHG